MSKYMKCLVLACFISANAFSAKLVLESDTIKPNSVIPDLYTCNGGDQSPALSWFGAPAKTQSFALEVKDPQAADGGEWTHWIVFNIPPTTNHLDAGASLPEGAIAAKNSWNTNNYRGPCPSFGMHTYEFNLYALDKVLTLDANASASQVLDAITSHVLATAKLTGLYQKIK